ncbi:GPI-anchored wall transfer protein 1 [Venturia nashicola]|nr:GPI-anchored wall transfer protein 1 [Venturia nashicola]
MNVHSPPPSVADQFPQMDKRKSNNYKALKESFVSNLSGGSVWEINEVSLVLPAGVLLWSVLQSRQRFFVPYTPAAAATDFLINCASALFAITVYSKQPLLLNIFLFTPAILALISPPSPKKTQGRPPLQASTTKNPSKMDPFPIKPFVTMYRGGMIIITCAAILAVDFKIFPRRFAKVENWGTSLMDLGVGSFVFSAGTVSARSVLKAQLAGKIPSLISRLKVSVRHSLPLLALGLIRLYSVKGTDYAEHVTEYGVHWNFFFTLGFLPPFVALCHSAFAMVRSYEILALAVGIAYEAMLDFTSLKAYIFTAPRDNLLSQNREGIFSLFGYLAIFLAGHAAGMYMLPRESTSALSEPVLSRARFSHFRKTAAGKLATWSVIWSALTAFALTYRGLNLQVSRRLANLPYVFWVAAFNCSHLTICCLIEQFCFPELYKSEDSEIEKRRCKAATSRLLYAFNRNGLPLFLLANLLTGAVNMTLPTIDMTRLASIGVLVLSSWERKSVADEALDNIGLVMEVGIIRVQ